MRQVNIGAETLRGINAPDALQQQLFATLGAKELPLH
jgi:hypothetical protein